MKKRRRRSSGRRGRTGQLRQQPRQAKDWSSDWKWRAGYMGGLTAPWVEGIAWPASLVGGALLANSGNAGLASIGNGLWYGAWTATALLPFAGVAAYLGFKAFAETIRSAVPPQG